MSKLSIGDLIIDSYGRECPIACEERRPSGKWLAGQGDRRIQHSGWPLVESNAFGRGCRCSPRWLVLRASTASDRNNCCSIAIYNLSPLQILVRDLCKRAGLSIHGQKRLGLYL